MKKEDLPISPHLQIYKPQITSVLSITHRITGLFLNFSIIIFLLWVMSLSFGRSTYETFIEYTKMIPVKIIFFFSLLGFFYHMLNGLRHIIWDFGYFIENKSSAILGYIVLFCSISASIIVSIKLGIIK